MTFKKITFIFIALLLSLLLFLQYWLIQSFTIDVSSKIGQAAFEVSRSTVETLVFRKPDLKFKSFAINSEISEQAQLELINSITRLSSEVNISLRDGQKDNFLTINSAGSSYKVDIPRTGIELSLDDMSNKILLSAFAFIFVGIIVAGYFAKRISKPLKDLQLASERVGRGEFGIQVPQDQQFKSIELKETVDAFNQMSQQVKQLQLENEKLQKQAQLSELAEITRGLAHTIRNPLNTLNLAVDELTTTKVESEKPELGRIAKHQVQRIDKWVRSLMEIMSTDKSLIERVDVTELLKTIIEEVSLNNNSFDIILTTQDLNTADGSFELQGIIPELKSLLISLITNAVEATQARHSDKPATEEMAVKIELALSNNGIEVVIIDQGIGFSEKILEKLFTPHNTDKTYGAGMGLYLAHRIATLKYNGDLKIVTNSPKGDSNAIGTKVTVTLNNRV